MSSRYLKLCSSMFVFGFILLPTVWAENRAKETTPTPDGRFGTSCGFQVGKEAVCRLVFHQLIANVEKYDGRKVSVFGYAAVVDGSLFVFENKSLADFGVTSSAVSVQLPFDDERDLANKISGKHVWITGTFSADFGDLYYPRLGVFNDLNGATVVEKNNTARRESDNDKSA